MTKTFFSFLSDEGRGGGDWQGLGVGVFLSRNRGGLLFGILLGLWRILIGRAGQVWDKIGLVIAGILDF